MSILLIVGGGEVCTALVGIAGALDWDAQVVDSLPAAEAALAALGPDDAAVVLSHHDGLDGPALAAALKSSAGYLGAMGSRRTQQRRREWLLAHGVDEAAQSAIRGPAGLDIGADAPAEIAVSIVAEIVAVRRDAAAVGSISDRDGPIHPDLAPGEAVCPGGCSPGRQQVALGSADSV